MAALEAIPADDWSRTWAAARTIMLRRTSKKVKDVVGTLLLPAVVHLSRDFWNDFRNGTREEIILSSQQALRLLPECWGSAQRCVTSISATIASNQAGQRRLQE